MCLLKPSCDGISSIESDNAVLSDALHVFYEIKKFMCITTISSYPNDEEEKFGSVLDDRQKMCYQCDSMDLIQGL